MKKIVTLIIFTVQLLSLSPASADEALLQAIRDGKFHIDERYRFETVEQDGFANDAKASTIRTRIGWTSGLFYGFVFGIELEDVTNIGQDKFNNTINGKGQFPVVADVESTEVNQLYLKYSGLPDTEIKVGRQVIVMDNHRFVGHVGWRQNNQTFDTALVKNTSIPGLTLTYGFISRVNRIFGNRSPVGNWESESHIIHAARKIDGIGVLTGYGYLFDFEDDSPLNATATYGFSLVGKRAVRGFDVHYRAEYAFQEDYADNPLNYDADYYHLAGGITVHGIKATVGYEVLSSDNGARAFATPLATLHLFNGYADQFLVTPANGLEDFYIDVTYKIKNAPADVSFLNGILLKMQYHDFQSDVGSVDLGDEIDFYVKVPLLRGAYAEFKYADYNGGPTRPDVEKFIIGIGWKY